MLTKGSIKAPKISSSVPKIFMNLKSITILDFPVSLPHGISLEISDSSSLIKKREVGVGGWEEKAVQVLKDGAARSLAAGAGWGEEGWQAVLELKPQYRHYCLKPARDLKALWEGGGSTGRAQWPEGRSNPPFPLSLADLP